MQDYCGRFFGIDPVRGDKTYKISCSMARLWEEWRDDDGTLYELCGMNDPRFFEPKEAQ